jgi:predicted O-methyltransferase YrrM
MTFDRSRLRWLKKLPVYRVLALPRRAVTGARYLAPGIGNLAAWLVTSREDTNFTYRLKERNLLYLAHLISVVTGEPVARVQELIAEIEQDDELRARMAVGVRNGEYGAITDPEIRYGRRIGWYVLIRCLKPRVVVETGVDKGLGSMVICAALKRNAEEGVQGRYYGTDLVPTAGWLLVPPYRDFGTFLIGDSIESLKTLNETIDLFINDSDHSDEYEAREYEVVAGKLSPNAVILGDNAHETRILADFATSRGMAYLFFKEEPEGHWYPGAGIGVAFHRT